jgi:hypothetical protein
MKNLICAGFVTLAVALAACSSATTKVTYNLACAAKCGSTGNTATIALTACDVDGQDPNAVANANVSACVTEAKKQGCPDPVCACQVERTANVCN